MEGFPKALLFVNDSGSRRHLYRVMRGYRLPGKRICRKEILLLFIRSCTNTVWKPKKMSVNATKFTVQLRMKIN